MKNTRVGDASSSSSLCSLFFFVLFGVRLDLPPV